MIPHKPETKVYETDRSNPDRAAVRGNMTEYDRVWVTASDLPPGQRLRFGLSTDRGLPIRFLCQLGFIHEGEWLPVARFDHDTCGPAYRNIERVGLHMDVFDSHGRQIDKKTDFPPVDLRDALDYAEDI